MNVYCDMWFSLFVFVENCVICIVVLSWVENDDDVVWVWFECFFFICECMLDEWIDFLLWCFVEVWWEDSWCEICLVDFDGDCFLVYECKVVFLVFE